MADPKSANDPSMDDILASIRKIISDDEARAQVSSQQAAASGRPAVVPPVAGRDDMLLLTDLIEEPKADAVPPPIPLPRIDPVRAAEMPQPSVEPVRSGDPTLVGGGAATTTATAFSRLNQAVQDSVPTPAAPIPARWSAPAARRSRSWSRRPCGRCSRNGSTRTCRSSSNATSKGRSSG